MDSPPAEAELAAAYGIATDYWDWRGQHVLVSRDTIVAVLAALDVDASTPAAVTAALRERTEQAWRRVLPAFTAVRAHTSADVFIHVPHGAPVEVWVRPENGAERALEQAHHVVEPREVDGRLLGEARFVLPTDLPTGYHELTAVSDGVELGRAPLVVTPHVVPLPRELARRSWGFAIQLYSVRSRRSWGLGDLSDLGDVAVWSAAEHGADFVLVNPLHAGDPVPQIEPSPYLPTTRRFTNPLYIRIEDIPELAYADPEVRAAVDRLARPLRAAAASADLLDRDGAWAAKLAALEVLSGVPRSLGRELEYRAYVEQAGTALTDFATWCVIAEQHGTKWRAWPAELQDPRSSAVADFRAAHADRVEVHCYAQWVAAEQMAAAQRRARAAGMNLGVVHDLPVGVHPDGADSWALQDVLAYGISVGAPPDAFNQHGQDWSQPPWRPDRLAATGYMAWRDLVRSVLRHGGGLRVDHVIGLFRLWWVPEGSPPTAGTYVRYDHEAMLGILALEAERAGAVLIGEDLGTVEPWVRDVLAERGILGTSVAWFEYDGAELKPPERWRELCLATVTVHDLPPSAAYFDGAHLDLRARLGLLTRPIEEERAEFAAERRRWLDALTARGLLTAEPGAADSGGGFEVVDPEMANSGADSGEVVVAMHRYVAQTPARLIGVSLADAVGDRRTQNQPGTHTEYANWRQPLTDADGRPVLLEDLPGRADLARLVAAVHSDDGSARAGRGDGGSAR